MTGWCWTKQVAWIGATNSPSLDKQWRINMDLPSRKVFLIETFILEISDHLEEEMEQVLNRMLVMFVACDYISKEEAQRIEGDCNALTGAGITYTDDGVRYT
jgi:hypothetical protein